MNRLLGISISFILYYGLYCGSVSALDEAAVNAMLSSAVAVFPSSVDEPAGGGSGVIISPDGYAVTNFHVVQPCGPSMKCSVWDANTDKAKLYDTVIVGMDPVGDIALIKLLGKTDFAFAELTDSDAVLVGDTAVVAGNPFLLSIDYKPCLSQGIISGTHRYQFPSGSFLEYTDCLQTDAAVNPGNSGGPLFNSEGKVIGIIGRCSFEKRGRVNVGVGYAVSSNQVRNFLGDLKSGRIIDHSTLNAVVSNDKSDIVKFEDVAGTSDAFRNGLRYNDELVRFAGKTVMSANTFKNLLGIFPQGWRLPLTVRGKDGKRFDLSVRTAGLHTEAELIELTQKMIEPPIIPPEFKKILEEHQKHLKEKKSDEKLPDILKGYKEIEVPGPDGKPVKVLQKEHQISEAVKPFYEKRRGYANFYFNGIEKERVLTKWRQSSLSAAGAEGDSPSAQTAIAHPKEGNLLSWNITGGIQNRPDSFSFQITSKGVNFKLPAESGFWDAYLMKQETIIVPDPLMHYQAPRGSGGLFTALFLMGQLAFNKNFEEAETVYTGTAPLDGDTDKLYDVITLSWFGNDARFYFAPQTGLLHLIEMFSSSLDNPCELRFRYAEDKTVMEVRYGKILFAVFEQTADGRRQTAEKTEVSPSTNGAADGSRQMGIIPAALARTVKIYGAEALSAGGAGIHGYQTGVIVSPDGYILTAITPALQADPLNVVLNTGRKYGAKIAGAVPELELTLLKIEAENLPFFTLDTNSEAVQIGEPVYALSNCFNIAVGSELVSVQYGHIAAKTSLHARRGVFETPYQGTVFALDFTVNNPGSCGGAIIKITASDSYTPELAAIIGKELRNKENNSWFNFAIPVNVFRNKVEEIIQQSKNGGLSAAMIKAEAVKPELELIPEDTLKIFQDWGILLIPNVGRRTPPFIDSVKKGSAAEELRLQPDDLIIMVNNRLTPSLAAVEYYLYQAQTGSKITLTIERQQKLFDIQLTKP